MGEGVREAEANLISARQASKDTRALTAHIITVETLFGKIERLWPRFWVRSKHHPDRSPKPLYRHHGRILISADETTQDLRIDASRFDSASRNNSIFSFSGHLRH
jgi:hypothetical protein